ncbi:CHAT domain-containing protein [Promicromonospora aerolata]|uniref:CHAT domain-containing protein n=1 Tax=Promicromonospora aerolata TaxID=195749 RepID=A0ABW4VG64_9MICO
MYLELLALLGGALVLVFYAGSGRLPFITRFRYPLTGLGFLSFAGASYLATTRDVPKGWGFDSASVAFVLAGGVALVRIVLAERQRAADPAYNPQAAATWYAEGQNHLRVFLARDDLASLDRAVDLFRQSVDATATHASHLTHLTALLTALQARYEQLRRLDDLDEAIDYGRRESGSDGGVRRGRVLSMLSTALRMRYDSVGAAGDLADAHEACRTAISLVPFYSRHYPRCSSELAALHRAEYERTQQPRSLDLAVEHVQKSLRSARVLGSARMVDLTTLCALLAERGRRTKNMRDLDDAVDIGRQSLRIVQPDDQLFQPCQNNLALALRARFELQPRTADLDEAIRLAHRATASVAPTAPQRADHQLNLALALHDRYRYEQRHTGEHARTGREIDWALEAARDAANHDAANVPTRIRAGLAWSDIAATTGRHADAVTALAGLIELLPRVASRELRREDQEDRLGRWTGIAANAAACALAAGQEDTALVLLEQGRGVLLSRALDARADLTALHARNPALATEFEELRAELDTAYDTSATLGDVLELAGPAESSADAGIAGADDRARRMRRAQTERWNDLLARIRAEDGLADFAGTPQLERILEQGADGPVVYLNVSEYRSDAIILRPEGVVTVPLRVTPRQVAEHTRRLHLALHPGNITDLEHQQAIHDVLGWLWDDVVEPVLDAAGVAAPASGEALPRMWWIPTGALALLPIHAAGRHTTESDHSLLDRAISSYAPTVRALTATRERRVAPAAPRPLVVAMSETPGAEPLGNAEAEAEMVRSLFPGGLLLQNGEATRQRVLSELPGHTWVHFACHGVIDRDIPSRSELLLHDHHERPFTTTDISRLDLPEPALAYLSSCETARTGPRHTDEAIHLASAFQLAGFPDVIATLWKIPDRVAHAFTQDTYTEFHRTIRSGSALTAARAVHEATRAARARYPNLPGLWAGYVHMGH